MEYFLTVSRMASRMTAAASSNVIAMSNVLPNA